MSPPREEQTIRAMMQIYCRAHHASDPGPLCEACQTLFEYAQVRLEKCPFGTEKPVCAKCPIHCYQPAMRQQIREVMRYAGPRMALRHPTLALAHLLQKNRPVPERGRKGTANKSPAAGTSGPESGGPNATTSDQGELDASAAKRLEKGNSTGKS